MRLSFVKMHSAGNDYVYIDGFKKRMPQLDCSALARWVSDRHRGVGSDGLIVLLPSERADFRMRIFNADGSEGDMCGNGVRCLAGYIWGDGLTGDSDFSVQTRDGLVNLNVSARNDCIWVEAEMTSPLFRRDSIPMLGPADTVCLGEQVEVLGVKIPVYAVRVGNPHCVIFVQDPDRVDLNTLGPVFERHPIFPDRTNVELAALQDRNSIAARVYERGSGITQSCGTGACAVAVVAIRRGRCDSPVAVRMPGGCLHVEWDGARELILSGPVHETFRGLMQVPDSLVVGYESENSPERDIDV